MLGANLTDGCTKVIPACCIGIGSPTREMGLVGGDIILYGVERLLLYRLVGGEGDKD